jgi:hypothetical protein
MKTSLSAPVSGRGFLLAAVRPISNLTATEAKRLVVSNGGSELGDFFVSIQGIEFVVLQLLVPAFS